VEKGFTTKYKVTKSCAAAIEPCYPKATGRNRDA
jgi:hypothetical protein